MEITREKQYEKQLLRKDLSEEKKEKLRRLLVQEGYDLDYQDSDSDMSEVGSEPFK